MIETMRPVLSLIMLVCLSAALPSGSSARDGGRRQDSPSSGVEDRGITALHQVLTELTNPYSVMCVAATLDDVDWGTLSYYHKRLGSRAILVLATRSQRAQDAPSAETEDRAVIATRQALAAARIAGADVHFLDLQDSTDLRSADDVLKRWGHDQALNR